MKNILCGLPGCRIVRPNPPRNPSAGGVQRATRYIGDAKIVVEYMDRPPHHDGRWYYRGTVTARGHTWHFNGLGTGVGGIRGTGGADSVLAYDDMAASAVSFGGTYDSESGSPSRDTADAISEAAWDSGENGGYYVRRTKTGKRHGPYGA